MAGVAELEHFCGYGSRHLNTVHYHPVQRDTLIYAAAAAIIIEDVNDPHKQEFLRGHDAEVSALDVSQSGKLVASGQLGSPSRKGAVAPVVIWDFDNRQVYIEFNGLAHSVLCLRFSPDGRFVVATGANQMIFVWDVSTGEAVFSRRTESPCFLGVWGPIVENQTSSRYPSYQLCTTYDNQVFVNTLAFDIRCMGYSMSSDSIQFPSAGLQRKHICGLVRGDFLFTGTSAGDMCVFSLRTKVFRASLPICNNGVMSIAQTGDVLFVAGGDGRIKGIRGHDLHWDVFAENVLEAGITALTCSSDGAELACGSRNGKLWRLLGSDLTATLQSVSHTKEVTDVAFGVASDVVATASEAGEIFLMDLSDYMPVATALSKSPVRSAVMSSTRPEILAGYDDGSLRAWSTQRAASEQLWQLQAHKDGVAVVRESQHYIVTGGQDFAVRFWHRSSRELLATFHNHKKPVCDLVIDNEKPYIAHSGSEDRLVVTYDLKQNKTLVQHSTPSSNVTGLSQRKDQEHEVVSCSLDGRILFWDVDYAEPTGCLAGPKGVSLKLRCCEVSPSGRYIATGTEDGNLYIYDLVSCSCIQECGGHSGAVARVRWSPDQKQIVSAGKDGCVIIWNFFEK
mmetsp:Transcript_30075/g.65597  ORF Transcript_30075/g.65597 Transcript_30075/m.65597 type:complete len:622 (+) Transcript_30075:180-2045(+)|eukprot:CAMPEP_0170603390 /NCGR_PEP_ID=MMETSP0224-20130122/18888_1 /TAXON_ID=285029 /ORGANISM="Togula jolla, Strain CCCM 725" /LENGTH=621 /DNA_ID=CAMNT_0010928271 /DNA_START=180 /DNA_END=2045 /DNA_ORIENTATION=+